MTLNIVKLVLIGERDLRKIAIKVDGSGKNLNSSKEKIINQHQSCATLYAVNSKVDSKENLPVLTFDSGGSRMIFSNFSICWWNAINMKHSHVNGTENVCSCPLLPTLLTYFMILHVQYIWFSEYGSNNLHSSAALTQVIIKIIHRTANWFIVYSLSTQNISSLKFLQPKTNMIEY